MSFKEEFLKVAKELIFPTSADPFADINKVTKRMEETARELHVQLSRLERLHRQNKVAADNLLSFLDEAKKAESPAEELRRTIPGDQKEGNENGHH